jgi:cobalamin biosynthesis Co2+ chelatase CbiK
MRAIILSTFGSYQKHTEYHKLKEYLQTKIDSDIYISLESKTIKERLANSGHHYKDLRDSIEYLLTKGYDKIVVSSINLFTNNYIQRIANEYKEVDYTSAIFSDRVDLVEYIDSTKDTSSLNLYILHGSKKSDISKYIDTINSQKLCKATTIEGKNNFFESTTIIEELKNKNSTSINIIPLLLVNGNHYTNDIQSIKQTVSKIAKTKIYKSDGLINSQKIKDIIEAKICYQSH